MKTYATLALALAGLIAGCASYEEPQTAALSKAIDLSKLDTFAINVRQASPTDTAFGPSAQEEAREALESELEALGYERTSASRADFVANFYSAIRSESEVFTQTYSQPEQQVVATQERVVTPTGGSSPIGTKNVVVTTYESRPITLEDQDRLYVLDIVDRNSNALLWRGYIAANDTEIDEEGEVESYVARIVDEMPSS